MAIDVDVSKTRRSVLAGALGGLGALVASALSKPLPVDAVANGDVQLGHGVSDTDNNSTLETRVNVTNPAATAFSAEVLGTGTGLRGIAGPGGTGILGSATFAGTGVAGQGDAGPGVAGTSTTGNGVEVTGSIGVLGTGSTGVKGVGSGQGVAGRTVDGYGVLAEATGSGYGRGLFASAAGISPALEAAGTGVGAGVQGENFDATPSTFSSPSNKTGVIGTAGAITSISTNTDEIGVYGYADVSGNSVGILGQSHKGTGVVGVGAVGVVGAGTWGVLGDVGTGQVGVYGNTGANPAPNPGTGVGVVARAETTAQIALKVFGRAQFSRSGRTYVAAGTSTRKITMTGVTTSSYIIATPQTNRAGVFVQAVVPAAGYFTIYLNKIVAGTTYVGYLVIN